MRLAACGPFELLLAGCRAREGAVPNTVPNGPEEEVWKSGTINGTEIALGDVTDWSDAGGPGIYFLFRRKHETF